MALERPESLSPWGKDGSGAETGGSDMLCWLLCKGKQVERARKGTRKESHLQERPEQRNQMWAPVSIVSGLLHNSPIVVLFMCLLWLVNHLLV